MRVRTEGKHISETLFAFSEGKESIQNKKKKKKGKHEEAIMVSNV